MNFKIISTLLLTLLISASCASQPYSAPDAPGFFMGILHGVISPLTLILSFFSEIRMYSFPNTGVWYDLGFYIGIAILGGGSAASRRK